MDWFGSDEKLTAIRVETTIGHAVNIILTHKITCNPKQLKMKSNT